MMVILLIFLLFGTVEISFQNVPKTEVSEWPLNFGDVRSVSDCHEECVGCSEPRSASACLSCKHFTQTLRNRAGYRCVSHCDAGFFADGDRCKRCSVHCESCTRAEVCETCHGAKLLIDTNDHYGHFDNGRCVDECPTGLVSDYTNLLQAKCVIKKNPCSTGYYENMHGNCVECDSACALCHGPGSLQCDECAADYGNRSLGYCRPCCEAAKNSTSNLLQFVDCEDCSANYSGPIHHNFFFSNGGNLFGDVTDETLRSGVWHFLFMLLALFFGAFFCCLLTQFLCVKWSNDESLRLFGFGSSGTVARSSMEYTPLKNVDDDMDLERHGIAVPEESGEIGCCISSGKFLKNTSQQSFNFSAELDKVSLASVDDELRTTK